MSESDRSLTEQASRCKSVLCRADELVVSSRVVGGGMEEGSEGSGCTYVRTYVCMIFRDKQSRV